MGLELRLRKASCGGRILGEIRIDVPVDIPSFLDANDDVDGMYYLADKGNLLAEILDQCVVEFWLDDEIINPTGSF
jgi:hypothetical protein